MSGVKSYSAISSSNRASRAPARAPAACCSGGGQWRWSTVMVMMNATSGLVGSDLELLRKPSCGPGPGLGRHLKLHHVHEHRMEHWQTGRVAGMSNQRPWWGGYSD